MKADPTFKTVETTDERYHVELCSVFVCVCGGCLTPFVSVCGDSGKLCGNSGSVGSWGPARRS